MALISANIQYNRGEHLLLDYSSLQSKYSVALAWAKDPYSNAAVGQFIYIQEAETIDGREYSKGPYVVDAIGENALLTPLSKGNAGDVDVSDIVNGIQSELSNIKTNISNTEDKANAALSAIGTKGTADTESSGLYAEIDLIKDSLENIEVPVNDVQVDGVSVVSDGIANIDMAGALAPYAKTIDISNTYATQDSLSAYAQISNVYTKDDADNKTIELVTAAINNIDVAGVGQEGKYVSDVKQVDGKIEVTLTDLPTISIPEYNIIKSDTAEGDSSATYRLTKNGVAVGASINIPKDMVVSSGSVVTLADNEVEGYAAGTYIKLILANSLNSVIYIAAADLVDVYTSGNKYITIDGYTINFNYNDIVLDLQGSLANSFDAKGAAETAQNNVISIVNDTLKDYAKTSEVSKTLELYAKTSEVTEILKQYDTTDVINTKIKLVSDVNDSQNNRLNVLEAVIAGSDGISLSQQVSNNASQIVILKDIVGNEADGETPASGLVAVAEDLTNRVISLENDSIKAITVNGVVVPVSDNIATINLINDLSVASGDELKLAVSANAVKNEIDSLKLSINSKASINLVDSVPIEGNTNVIYLEKNAEGKIAEKIYLSDGSYHIIGSDLYASKDVATQELNGLMSATDKIKLDNITNITSTELEDIINS